MIEFIQSVDFFILDFIHNNLTMQILDPVMVFITTLGNGGMIWIVISILMLFTKKYRETGIMMAIGLLLCLILGNIILKPNIARLRPFMFKEGIELIIKAPRDYSFPSGHTFSSVLSAVIIFMQHKKIGSYALCLAFLISFSRLYLYVHFPSDVIAGAVLGVLVALLSVKGTLKILKKEKI